MKNRYPLFIILTLPVVVCLLAWYFWFSPATTVVLVRHAERLNDTDTTSISEVGIQRAQALAHVLNSSGVKHIYVSEKARTAQTAAPTATAFDIVPIPIRANDIAQYIDSIKAHRGDLTLIVGHSDTVPQIIGKLGISQVPTIGRTEFDHLFIITVFRFRSTMTRLRFGNPSQ
jgi:phosphohistidine phosphatase SixA